MDAPLSEPELLAILNARAEAKRTRKQLMCEHDWSRAETKTFVHTTGFEIRLTMLGCEKCAAWMARPGLTEDELKADGWVESKEN